jgi:hypothetical protein
MAERSIYEYSISLTTFFCLLTLLSFSGCQKIINVDLNEAAPNIVIEGLITDHPGPYAIFISKSGSYFNQPDLLPVSFANVKISDNVGIIDSLKEIRPGVYLTSKIHGIPGRTYTLKVISENIEYTGSSTMYSRVGIDSVNFTKSISQHFDFGGDNMNELQVDLNCYFRDPVEKNFYRLKVFINDSARVDNYRLYDDQYTNGMEIGLRASHARSGSTYRLELYSLDSKTYGYYRTLEDLLNNNPIFGSTPANPNTNLSNGALGYFGAAAYSSKTIRVNDYLLQTAR